MNCSCLEAAESHVTFDLFLDGVENSDDLDTEEVPPYEDRLGPDGAEGENPDLPSAGAVNMTKSDDDDQYDDDREEQSKLIASLTAAVGSRQLAVQYFIPDWTD